MVTAVSTAAPTSYPMSIAAAAAAAHNNPTVSVNSALFNRTYAQTIHNLTSLTKGLIMAPQLSGSFIGSMKTSAVQQGKLYVNLLKFVRLGKSTDQSLKIN